MKLVLRESKGSVASPIVDTELVLKSRITMISSKMLLEERDSIDVVVVETRADDDKRGDLGMSISLLDRMIKAPHSNKVVPPKRFMTYDEYLLSASRVEDDFLKDTATGLTSWSSSVSTS